MALQYQSITHGDLGGSGIDALSSEDAIQDGYAEDLLNVDASPQGYLSKRVGYQQMYGQLPVRVLGMEYLEKGIIQFTLDASIDLSSIPSPIHSRPIVISGKTSQITVGTSYPVTQDALNPSHLITSPLPNNGDIIYFETTGTLPIGLSLWTPYYVRKGVGSTYFTVSSTIDGASLTGLTLATPGTLSMRQYNGDFWAGKEIARYYPGFDADVRRELLSGDHSVQILATEHGLTSPFMAVGTALSDSTVSRSNSVFFPNYVSIDEVSYDITVNEVNSGTNKKQYVYWSDKTAVPGFTYVSPVPSSPNVAANTETTLFYPASTHSLTSKNIQVLVYKALLGSYQQIIPSSVTIDDKTGNVYVGIENFSNTTLSVFCILSVVDPDRAITSTQYDSQTGQVKIQIQNPPTPYIFASCYKNDGTTKVQVYPDLISYKDESDVVEILFTSAINQVFSVYWEPGYIISNRLRVAADTPTMNLIKDTRPQLTLWGLDHSNLYLNPEKTHAGWVTHLDTYRSAGNNFLVAGLGGNLFSGEELDAGTKVSYKIPSLYPNLRTRTAADVTCGPAFMGTMSGPNPVTQTARAGGAVASPDWGGGFANSYSLEYIKTGTGATQGYVRIILRSSNVRIIPPISGPTVPIVAGKDRLNVEEAGNPIHNGIWQIIQANIYDTNTDPQDPRVELIVQNLTIKKLVTENPGLVGTGIWDSTTGAKCGIFSGRIQMQEAPSEVRFLPGDTIISSNLTASEPIEVASVDGSELNLLNFYQLESFPSATVIVGRRVSDVISVRNASDEESVEGFAWTDNLQLTGYAREFKIKSINPLPTLNVLSISPDTTVVNDQEIAIASVELGLARDAGKLCGFTSSSIFYVTGATILHGFNTATPITFTGTLLPTGILPQTTYYVIYLDPFNFQISATPYGTALSVSGSVSSNFKVHLSEPKPAYSLAAGDRVILNGAGVYTGNQEVITILDETHFAFAAEETVSLTYNAVTQPMHLVGKTLHIDEEILWADSLASTTSLSVPGRWLPIEAPEHTSDLAPTTYKRYLENSAYDAQPILRSTQVADTLFLNNGDDRTLKIDGSNLYRPGLIRWQPELFFSQATANGLGSIDLVNIKTPLVSPYWEAGTNHFYVSEVNVGAFPDGTQIRRAGDSSTIYTVIKSTNSANGSSHLIYVDKNITGTPGQDTLVSTSTYSYYFRLNAVDANQNVVASAATGSYDCTINATTAFQNRIRMVGLPTLDIYDYERIEVQVYRTKQNGVAPYYLLTTISIPFDANQGYIDYIDTTADYLIGATSQLDPVNTALKGQELGLGWSAPVRAKHLTSAANRLILGNLTSDPYIDLILRNIGGTVNKTDLSGKRFLLRKSNLDNATDTNMLDRIGYEFVTSTTHTITSVSYANQEVLLTFGGNHDRQVGDWIYLFRDTQLTNLNTYLMGWWQVLAVPSATTLKFKWIPSNDSPVPFAASYVANTSTGSNANILTIPSDGTSSIPLGASVVGPGIPTGTVVTAILTSTTIQMSQNATANATGVTVYISTEVNRMAHASNGRDVPVWLGTDLNYQTTNGQPSSSGIGIQNLAMRRLANAVNATQRMVNPSIQYTMPSGFVAKMSDFRPWIVANAGSEFAEGQLILTQPMNQETTFELVLPETFLNFSIFANGVERSQKDQVQAREDLHPSRILVSYPNFPEIFDSPFATVDSQSDSALDINPADGQEITAVIPFFGSSAFGAALKDAVVVVFKTNSIYVVNLAAKAAGQNAVQRIESQGLGCTAPYSVAVVRDGVMFANASGIYKLRTDLSIYYMGRYMQRQWRNRVGAGKLDLVFGHNWSFGSQYKLSVPTDSSTIPDETFVYNSTREYSLEGPNTQAHREGSWVRHRGFNAIGWCNLDADSFYANTRGQVLILRRTGEASDWRDDTNSIEMDVVLRAMDFGDEGIRKTVPYALISYRNPWNQGVRTGTQVFYTTDLFDAFYEADPTVIPNRAEAQGLSDEWSQKVVTFRYSFNNKRGIRFQLRIKNLKKDESVEIARVRYSVAGLSIKGVMQAAQSPAYSKT